MTDIRATLRIGRIKAPLAYLNHYAVTLRGDRSSRTAVDISTGSDRRGGHKGGGAYLPNAHVLVVDFDQTMADTVEIIPCLILGAFSAFPMSTVSNPAFAPTIYNNESLADFNTNKVNELLLNSTTIPVFNQNRSYNRPLDAQPGEWYKVAPLGGAFRLTDYMAYMGASPAAYLSFCYHNDMAELSARNIVIDNEAYSCQILQRGEDPVIIEGLAFNTLEGLGVAFNQPAFQDAADENDPSKLACISEKQEGFFRHMLLKGGSVEGSWDTMKTDPLQSGRTVYEYGENVYPGMLSEMKREDGVYRLRAAREIKLEKTSNILVPTLTDEIRCTDKVVQDLPEVSVEEQFGLSEEELGAVMPILHEQIADFEERNIFFEGLRRDGDIWYFPSREEIDEALFGSGATQGLPVLPEEDDEYTLETLEPIISEVEAYPGRKIKIFKNSSVFLMATDGGVTLGDGFGGELRMNRGTVTIASAGDTQFLAGRDIVQWAPRNHITRARDRVEIASTQDNVAIKAHKNFNTVSGIGGLGATILENRAAGDNLTTVTADDLQKGEAVGSGVVVKARDAGISLLANFLYAAGHATTGQAKQGVNRSVVGCDILLDSGARTTLLTGSDGAVRYKNSLAMSMIDSVTGMYLSNGQMVTTSPGTHVINSPFVHFDKGTGRVETPELTRSGIRNLKVAVPTAPPQVQIEGALFTRAGVFTEGSILSEAGITANGGCNPLPLVGRDRVTLNLIDSQPQRVKEAIDVANQVTQAALETTLSRGISTEYGQQITDFAFPNSKSIYQAAKFQLVAPRWQTILDSNVVWEEKPVAHSIVKGGSFPYPGRDAFERTDTVLSYEQGSVPTQILQAVPAAAALGRTATQVGLRKVATGLQQYLINRER
jgi:hypothetical protein